ncbi:MAG: hypothetical protein ACXVX5_01215 [Mycobacterium sp.]
MGCPLWPARPGYQHEDRPNFPEFRRPLAWPKIQAEGNLQRLLEGCHPPTDLDPRTSAVCGNMGGKLAVVDVDPKNGGDIEKMRGLLAELGVRIFAEVATPSAGRHFYIAGHEDLPTVHSTTKNKRLPDYPGVDILSYRAHVYLPGTYRWRKGKGYEILFDDLDALTNDGDPQGAESFADWVAQQLASHAHSSAKSRERSEQQLARNAHSSAKGREQSEFVFDPAPQWDGTPPDTRQQKYLDATLAAEVAKVSAAQEGGRNDALNLAALKLGHYIAGAGMNQDNVIDALMGAARENGLVDDDGERSPKATIRSGLRAGKKTPRAVPPGRADEVPPDKMSHEEFWAKTETLRHVRGLARARRVGPWGLLGASLARVVAVVPPTVQLPPLVGDEQVYRGSPGGLRIDRCGDHTCWERIGVTMQRAGVCPERDP